MKFLVALLLTALLSFISGLYFPWWAIAVAAFGVAWLVPQRAWKAFLAGFLGLFILWSGLAWWIDIANQHLLSAKIGVLMGVGPHSMLLILVTGAVGGLVAGVASMTGSYLQKAAG